MTGSTDYPLKRPLDIAGALVGLAVSWPVMFAVGVLVRLRLGAPVLFRQTRAGRGGVPFDIVKFRTMRDGDGTDDERLTPFGRRLRAWSLDELPELLNVLRGDMSLVGPRPLLMSYIDRYSDHQQRRHEARPGLTGLAQVEGRNQTTWEERLDLDVAYLDRQSLALDLRIIAKTLVQVIRSEGATTEDGSTMAEFMGTDGR